jgi:hypothetical protein
MENERGEGGESFMASCVYQVKLAPNKSPVYKWLNILHSMECVTFDWREAAVVVLLNNAFSYLFSSAIPDLYSDSRISEVHLKCLANSKFPELCTSSI